MVDIVFVVLSIALQVMTVQAQVEGCNATTNQLTLDYLACENGLGSTLPSSSAVGPVIFETCCPNVAAGESWRLLWGSNNHETSFRTLQLAETCRITEITNAYCDVGQDSGCEVQYANLELEFNFLYERLTSDDLCCSSCVCWGDPRCTAFDGSRDNWVICDDRRAGDCQHGPVRCHNQKDPWGNQCEYVRRTRVPDSNATQPWWYNWDESGSPCQSKSIWEGTALPTMVMYDGYGQVTTLTLGERGIITGVTIVQNGVNYTLSSATCLSDFSASAWISSDFSNIPDKWAVVLESSTRIRWNIQNLDGTTSTSILCLATSDYRTRLDVDLKIPNGGAGNLSGEGFCITGNIQENSKGTGTLNITQDDLCLRRELGSCIEACKALVDASCEDANLEENVNVWCTFNDYTGVTPAINSIGECVSRIFSEENCNETSFQWADIICQIDNMNADKTGYSESGYQMCLTNIADNTWFQYVADRPAYSIPSLDVIPAECIADVQEYNRSKPYMCAVGVQVQSFNNLTSVWEDEFFIPVDYSPCDNFLNISGVDFPNLMTRPIRFKQCESIQSECAMENSCLPTNGFQVKATYSMEYCPPPTPSPTESPIGTEGGCYECLQQPRSQRPEICATENQFYELGSCETCCVPAENETLPVLNENGYCRYQETSRPYCNMSNNEEAAYCAQLKTGGGLLEIQIQYSDAEDAPTTCCRDCAVYGDPEMTSFADTTLSLNISAWIICDGRVIQDSDDACPIEEEQCTKELDQDGNRCYYNTTRAALLTDQSNIGAVGSPCQANPNSGEATMELYTIPDGDFSFFILLGERAVITESRFVIAGEYITLVSSECFGEAGSGWTNDPSSFFTDVTYDASDVRSTPRGAERTWSFVYDNTIYVQITCIKMVAQGGDAQDITGYRMNIDHIIDSDLERSGSDNATGFCPTSAIDYMNASVTDTSKGSVFNVCTWQQWSQALTLAKALVSTATTASQINEAIQTWCETANVFQTSSNPEVECYSAITGTNADSESIGFRWTVQYCNAISNNRGDISVSQWRNRCTSQIKEETFGIVNFVETYGTGAKDTDNTCSSNPSYKLSSNVCQEGIFVEYFDAEISDWTEEFFVPALNLPCNGTIAVTYTEHPNLFTNMIRFRQCDQPANNGCSLAYSCKSAQGFSIMYRFSQDESICEDESGSS